MNRYQNFNEIMVGKTLLCVRLMQNIIWDMIQTQIQRFVKLILKVNDYCFLKQFSDSFESLFI
jgi:hypothetical protein